MNTLPIDTEVIWQWKIKIGMGARLSRFKCQIFFYLSDLMSLLHYVSSYL